MTCIINCCKSIYYACTSTPVQNANLAAPSPVAAPAANVSQSRAPSQIIQPQSYQGVPPSPSQAQRVSISARMRGNLVMDVAVMPQEQYSPGDGPGMGSLSNFISNRRALNAAFNVRLETTQDPDLVTQVSITAMSLMNPALDEADQPQENKSST